MLGTDTGAAARANARTKDASTLKNFMGLPWTRRYHKAHLSSLSAARRSRSLARLCYSKDILKPRTTSSTKFSTFVLLTLKGDNRILSVLGGNTNESRKIGRAHV